MKSIIQRPLSMRLYSMGPLIRQLVLLTGLIVSMSASRLSAADYGASLKVGTPGFGGELTVGINQKINLRAGLNYFFWRIKPEEEQDNSENITVDVNLTSIPVLLDWHPFNSNFRLSLGLAWNDNKLSARAKPGDELDFNDRAYWVEDFYAEITFNRISPYFGIGYGNAVRQDSRWTLALDLGAFYHGAPQLDARATAMHPGLQPVLDQDLAREVDDIEDDLDSFRFYPALSVGLSYRF